MGDGRNLEIVLKPQAYFRDLISNAMRNQRIEVRPESEVYLVSLLNSFIKADRLFVINENGRKDERPLALLIQDAFEEATREAQRLMFRQVGDLSLYMAGFFQDSLSRRRIHLDYYIEMGGIAYSQVASIEDEKNLKEMYGELASRFDSFVNILAEVSEVTTPNQNAKDLFSLYETWLETGSRRAQKALQKAGIQTEVPVSPKRSSNSDESS